MSPARAPRARDNLPSPVASFVGRRTELAELDKLIGRDRLVTIVGTGGAGKTRLAIEAAAARLGEYHDGVWFVDLAELSDPAEVAAAIAAATGLQQVPGQAEPLLMEHVTAMQALLVVDNCGHLVGAVAAPWRRCWKPGREAGSRDQPAAAAGAR